MDYWYKYRDDLYKLVHMENEGQRTQRDDDVVSTVDEKTRDNIRRAARTIEGYALCNDWQYFATFTLNAKYRSREDLDGFRDALQRFIRDERERLSAPDLRVLLVPELHPKKKTGWHMHGLILGLPEAALRPFTLGEKLPLYLIRKLKAGEFIYDWPQYRDKFGWVDIETIRNRDAAARYITKYVSKGLDSTAKHIDLGKHLYFVSRGLRQPVLQFQKENASVAFPKAFPRGLVADHSYSFDYGTVTWYVKR